jgi:hypothetical protein
MRITILAYVIACDSPLLALDQEIAATMRARLDGLALSPARSGPFRQLIEKAARW